MIKEESLHNLILRFSSLSFRSTEFEPSLESRFADETSSFRVRRQWLEGLFSLSLCVAFELVAYLAEPARPVRESLLHFGIIVPCALLINAMIWFQVTSTLREAAIAAATCITASVEIVYSLMHRAGAHYSAQLPVVAAFVFVNTVMRLRLPQAIATLVWGLCAEGLLVTSGYRVMGRLPLHEAMMALAIGVLTLIANYSQDREVRLAFLRYAEKANQADSLAESNKHLETVAHVDSLTGLANRAALETRLRNLWADPRLSRIDCAIVMLDIDHFKRLNDRYGHLYGDKVLMRVAHLISEALRGEEDLVARYGGEEFIVVLPRTSISQGALVAERLRSLVELAGLPALRTGDPSLSGLRATISCGVVSAKPYLFPEPNELIGIADDALYKAKRGGRNLVRIGRAEIGRPPSSAAVALRIVSATGK